MSHRHDFRFADDAGLPFGMDRRAPMPLLEGKSAPAYGDRPTDGTGLAQAIAIGVMISVPLWALIVWAGWSIGQIIAPG